MLSHRIPTIYLAEITIAQVCTKTNRMSHLFVAFVWFSDMMKITLMISVRLVSSFPHSKLQRKREIKCYSQSLIQCFHYVVMRKKRNRQRKKKRGKNGKKEIIQRREWITFEFVCADNHYDESMRRHSN